MASSAPRAGSAPGAVDTAATSAVEYYYAEAKVQAMGRGLLGFQQLKTRDLQTLIETTTSYRQDFPFTGLPVSTEVKTSSERLLSASETTWKLKGYQTTWGDTARTSGTAALDAFQPYAAEIVERIYDLNGGTDAMPDLVSTVTTGQGHPHSAVRDSGSGQGHPGSGQGGQRDRDTQESRTPTAGKESRKESMGVKGSQGHPRNAGSIFTTTEDETMLAVVRYSANCQTSGGSWNYSAQSACRGRHGVASRDQE